MGATMSGSRRRGESRAHMRRRLVGVLAGLTVLGAGVLPTLGAAPAGATTPACQDRWTNPAGGAWATPGNWSSGVPSSAEVACVTIPTSAPVTGSTITVGGLVVGGPAGTAGTSTLALVGTTTISGAATVATTGVVTAQNTLDQAAGTLVVDGSLSSSANLSIKGSGGLTVGSTGVFEANDQVLLDGPGTFTNEGAVVVPSGASFYADPSPSTVTFDNAGGVLLDEGADVEFQAGSTFVEGAGAAVATATVGTSDAAVRTIGATLDLTGTGSSSFLMQGGTLEGSLAAGQTVHATGIVTTSGPVVNHGALLFPSGGTLDIDPASTLTNDGLLVSRSGQVNVSGTLDNEADGTIQVDSSQLALQNAYNLHNDGTISIAPAGDVLATHSTGMSATIENEAGRIENGNATTGGFTVDSGATFAESAGTTTGNVVQVEGSLDLSGTGASSFLLSNGTISGDVAADQAVTIQGTDSTTASFTNTGTLELRSDTVTLAAGSTLTNDGVLGLAGGESNVNGSITNASQGTLTIDHGTELTDSTPGATFENDGEMYLLDGDELLLGAGTSFVNTGDVRFGVVGAAGAASGTTRRSPSTARRPRRSSSRARSSPCSRSRTRRAT